MLRNTIFVFVAALIAILSGIVLKQRSTIRSLREEAAEKVVVGEPAVQFTDTLGPADRVIHETESVAIKSDVAAPSASAPSLTSSPVSVNVKPPDDRDALQAQVQELQAELARTKRLVPDAEDPALAYVGAGTWVNAALQNPGITKIVITGEPRGFGTVSQMTIKGWGSCSGGDCEWTEVPFHLLDRIKGPRMYRRGFAAWEYDHGIRRYLLITFEKSGLRIDQVRFRSGKATPISDVEQMTRIQ